jgi:hypothetical protein
MRRVALLLFVGFGAGACGARATGPAWPKSAGTERIGDASEDGGESLAPRVATAAVVEGPAEEAPAPEAAPVAAPKPDAKPTDGAAPAPAAGPDATTPVILDFEETIEIDAK